MRQSRNVMRRGFSLVAALWIIIALTGLVLSLGYSVRLEALASANRAAILQAEAAERGAEQYLLMAVDSELYSFGSMKNFSFEARKIGDCYVWFINAVPGSNTLTYGPIDEGGKFNLNILSASNNNMTDTRRYDMLMALPGMADEQASSIMDWLDLNGTPYGSGGAEDEYYTTLNPPYHTKNADFEALDELLLVKGFSVDTLYGADKNRNGIIDGNENAGSNDGTNGLGLAPYVTAYGVAQTYSSSSGGGGGLPPTTTRITTYRVNLNTAPYEVLRALFSITGNTQTAESVAKDLVSYRENLTTSDASEITRWLQNYNRALYSSVAPYVNSASSTSSEGKTPSLVFSADILAVTRDGRAFKRYRVVAQGSSTQTNVTKIIFRQDITAAGWPLDTDIRARLKRGEELNAN